MGGTRPWEIYHLAINQSSQVLYSSHLREIMNMLTGELVANVPVGREDFGI